MNYLSHLAARALNQLPVVQPHLPSRFEAARRGVVEDKSARAEHATFTSSSPAIPMGTIAVAPEPIQVIPEDPSAPLVIQPTIREIANLPHATPEPVVDKAMSVQYEEPRQFRESVQPAPIPSTVVLEHQITTHIIERESPIILPAYAPPTEHKLNLEQLTWIEREHLPQPILAASSEAPLSRLRPQVTPYIPPAPEHIPVPEPTPIIQISIGRIEVRAVHSPIAEAPPRPAPKPTLSLDDYLRGVRR